ncbi:MAG: hypothetical protein ABIP03_07440 [Aquihabitans sp.]
MTSTVVPRTAVRRWGAGTAAVVRLLVASEVPLTGVAIAAAVGVTQPRVSQVLSQLATHHAVAAVDDGYVGDPDVLLDLYRTRARPHLAVPETYWYSTRPPTDQADRLVETATEEQISIAFSADLAPDLLAPWRHPTATVVYADQPLVLDDAGFVPAEGRADASIIVRWTSDPRLLSPAPPWPDEIDGLPLVDPCQQWWDLLDLGGEDRAEAAARLRGAIISRRLANAP